MTSPHPKRSSRPAARLGVAATLLGLAAALLLSYAPALATGANVLPSVYEPAGTGGYAALDRALAKLATHRRLLVIGAHPDDEDTSALALVSRELGGEAAYLSLSRGEGGQNLIGPDLGEALGVLRTEELLAARGVDGARQYFTRAFDFGYTRSLPETLGKWPEEVLLTDAVRVIRRFKPQVILSVFGNDGSGGHGQHQAAGHTAYLAFARSAEDLPQPTGELGAPWKATALFRAAWFSPESATVSRPLGAIDPWSGLSILQVAMKSRSQHRSQDMGRLLDLGPRDGKYTFVEGAAGAQGSDLFAGIDTSLAGLASTLGTTSLAGSVRRELESAAAEIVSAGAALRPERMADTIAPLVRALAALDRARAACIRSTLPEARPVAELLGEKIAIGEQALLIASGIAVDAWADSAELVAGEPVKLSVAVWNAGAAPVEPVSVGWSGALGAAVPGGATTGNVEQQLAAHPTIAPGELVQFEQTITFNREAPATRPYFLAGPRHGDVYDWSAARLDERGEPFGAPALSAHLELELAGRRVAFDREAVYRYADQARGEIRKPLAVVPRIEYRVSPEVVVWPAGGKAPELSIELASHLARPVEGELAFDADCGERPTISTPFRIAEPRGTATLRIPAPDCPAAGKSRVHLVLAATTSDGERALPAAPLLDYPHVPPMPLRGGDGFDLVRADIALPQLARIGYVLGASDKVPGLLAEVGLPIALLSAADLDHGDLGRYDAIVIGSRAYETDTALQKANARLLDYVRAGGLMIVQYQQYPFIDGKFAPLPLEIARPHGRITDETAAAKLLVPDHPTFMTPNRLAAADWDGWVQERALYMPSTWDAAFTPLLEFQDPGQPAQRGGLLVAGLGKGTYVYTGLAFFRQLPAGVPGAYRLFANLLALGRSGAERQSAFAARGKELADRFLVVDTHIDVPYRLKDEMEDVSLRTAKGDFDYPRAVAGGLDTTFMSIYVPAKLQESGGAKALADELIDMVEGIAAAAPSKWAMAATPDQALANRAAGKLSFALGIENGAALEDQLANVAHFHARGVRYVTLTHGKNNLICDSSYEPAENRRWHGLSPFGREVVAEMNRLGIMVDLSHVSDEAFDQALALSKAPPIASHSSCRHFTPGFERNVDDARISALAAKGGVVQINFGSSFLTAAANKNALDGFLAQTAFVKEKGIDENSPEAKAFEAEWAKKNPLPRANLDDVVAHIDHVVEIAGIDHVGLGSDFDGVGDSLPHGLRDVAMYPNLFARLLERGYSEADLEKIAGGNLMRVWRETERVSEGLRR